jgi:anti-sigma factor RsiW
MTPDKTHHLLHAYIDGELDAGSIMELESQIQRSAALKRELECLSALQQLLQNRATRFNAPSSLFHSLSAEFPGSRGQSHGVGVPSWWRTLALGTTAATLVLLLWSLWFIFVGREPPSVMVEEVVSAHIRSLLGDHLTDVASAERHAVKPWLSSRLDFAPPVHEFATEGFVLLGGRLDYISGKPAAAIVYRYRQHLINVFVWPAPENSAKSIEVSNQRGYNSATFAAAGMNYRVISDLNQHDLGRLAQLIQSRSAMN